MTPPSRKQVSSEHQAQQSQIETQFQRGKPQNQNVHSKNLPPLPPQNLHSFNRQHRIPMPVPMPAQPSNVMLPPLPPHPGYSTVKREGVVLDEQGRGKDVQDDEESEPSFAALGGRPRSVDFQRQRQRRETTSEDDHFLIHVSHVYKRAAQEMTDVKTTRIIQVMMILSRMFIVFKLIFKISFSCPSGRCSRRCSI